MVAHPRKTLRADTVRPVDLPEPVAVNESPGGRPAAVHLRRRQSVIAVEDAWRIDDEWWRAEPLSRLYYAVILDDVRRLVIFKDLMGGRWYQQNY